jgi:hypothetical protein
MSGIAIVVLSLVGVAARIEASDCKDVHQDLPGPLFGCPDSPIGLCSSGTVDSGTIKGSKEAVYLGLVPSAGLTGVEPGATMSYAGTSVFHTAEGDLHTSFVGVIDTIRLVFTEVSRITHGTGGWVNATGDLFISGTVTADGASFESQMTGRVCR